MENQKFGAFKAILTILFVTAVTALTLFFQSCQTARVAQTTQMQLRDSLTEETISKTDTIIIRDTIYIESKTTYDERSATHITFSPEGGTYNTATGEATGVVAVDRDAEISYLNEVIANLTSENRRMEAENYHLKDEIRNQAQNQTQVPQEMSRWERFFYISGYVLWGVVVALLVLLTIKIVIKIKRAMP